jgi:hypothetical protein
MHEDYKMGVGAKGFDIRTKAAFYGPKTSITDLAKERLLISVSFFRWGS